MHLPRPGTPTSWARRSTSRSTCATSSSAPRRARPPRAWPAARCARRFCARSASRCARTSCRSPPCTRPSPGRALTLAGLRRSRQLAGALPRRGRRRARWCARSTTCARPTSRSAASSRCRRSGCVPGLGSHVSWEERMDGRLAMAICSIQAVKGASMGDAFTVAGAARLAGARRDLLLLRARLLPRDQSRRRPGGRHDQRPAAGRARRDEAAADADQAAALGRHRDARAGAGAARAHRLVHGSSRRRRRRGDGRIRARRCLPTKFGGDHIDDVLEAVGAYRERIGWPA